MEQILLYTGKVSLATALFYLAFRVLFRQRKQFRFNRFYLLFSMAAGFIIPLITLTVTRAELPQIVILTEGGASSPEAALIPSQNPLSLTEFLFYLYLAGAFFFLIRLVAGHLKAWEIIRHCRTSVINNAPLLVSETPVHPFTFFNKVVIARETTEHPRLSMILEHENIHAREKHTFDIMLSEVMFLFQWFNPFAWLHKEAVKNNIEFLTDEEVIRHTNMKDYQLALVSLADKKGVTPFLNALNGTDLKNRIIMMKQKTENKNTGIRRMALLPLLALMIVGLSNKEYKAAAGTVTGITALSENMLQGISSDSIKKTTTRVIVTTNETMAVDKPEFTASLIADSISISTTTINKEKGSGDTIRIRTVVSYPSSQPLYILDGKPIASIEEILPENIESISVLKDQSATALYGEKGKNGVIIIVSKKKETLPDDLLIFLDGKETTKKITEIGPEDIQLINVLKGESATTAYGEKGKNGVIEITTKSAVQGNPSSLNSINDLRKHLASNIKYPVKAQESGLQSKETVYGYVSETGKIIRITDKKPDDKAISIDEVVVVGYAIDPQKAAKSQAPSGNKSSLLNDEASLQVRDLPDIAIPGFKGRWLKFQFVFVLQ